MRKQCTSEKKHRFRAENAHQRAGKRDRLMQPLPESSARFNVTLAFRRCHPPNPMRAIAP